MCSYCEYLDDFGLEQIKYIRAFNIIYKSPYLTIINLLSIETNAKSVVKKTTQHHYQNVTLKPSQKYVHVNSEHIHRSRRLLKVIGPISSKIFKSNTFEDWIRLLKCWTLMEMLRRHCRSKSGIPIQQRNFSKLIQKRMLALMLAMII